MLLRIYEQYYLPLAPDGPFMIVENPVDDWIKIAWRNQRDRFDEAKIRQYLTPTFIEIDKSTYNQMMAQTQLELCRLGTRHGILAGLGSLVRLRHQR